MKKGIFSKFLSFALMVVMVTSITVMPVYANQASDISNHWAEDVINAWLEKGLMNGYEDGTFRPELGIKRAEFVKLINNAMGFTTTSDINYDDVKAEDWFYKDVQIAKNVGYITGYSDKTFGPNDPLTREQATAILVRISKLDKNEDASKSFDDSSLISEWAKGEVGAAIEVSYIKGYDDNTFKPQRNLSRAEAVSMLDGIVNTKNVIINKTGQELKDEIVEGDVIITKSLGEGDAYIKNVEVKGTVIVNGGGTNSIHIQNTSASKIQVNKSTPVRLSLEDKSQISSIEILGNCKLESKGDSVVDTVSINTTEPVTLTGNIKNLTVESSAKVVLQGATVEKLTVNSNAALEIDKDSKVVVADINGEATITGEGKIETLNANADNIKIEVVVDEIKIGSDVKVPPVVTDPAPPVSGGGGGGGEVTPPTPPVEQKILKITSSSNPSIVANISYNSNDTLQSVFKTFINDTTNENSVNQIIGKMQDVKINGKNVWSEEIFNKIANIYKIESDSELYKNLKPANFTQINITDMRKIFNSDALITHIKANKTDIKGNIDKLDLENMMITKGLTTTKLGEIKFSAKFGTEEKTTLSAVIDYLFTNIDNLTGTIDNITFGNFTLKITAPNVNEITIERTTLK